MGTGRLAESGLSASAHRITYRDFFGSYPAWKAAQEDPITALRG
ncbi:MAG: hypothetical protein R2860_02320 [Desulfobacterales bacterium]